MGGIGFRFFNFNFHEAGYSFFLKHYKDSEILKNGWASSKAKEANKD
jgi:hypothetical protein